MKRDIYPPYDTDIPHHIKTGIIKGQTQRIIVTCFEKYIYRIALRGLIQRFIFKGYPSNIIYKYIANYNLFDVDKFLNGIYIRNNIKLFLHAHNSTFSVDKIPLYKIVKKIVHHAFPFVIDGKKYYKNDVESLLYKYAPDKPFVIPYLTSRLNDVIRSHPNRTGYLVNTITPSIYGAIRRSGDKFVIPPHTDPLCDATINDKLIFSAWSDYPYHYERNISYS